jgi:hypothetical protein
MRRIRPAGSPARDDGRALVARWSPATNSEGFRYFAGAGTSVLSPSMPIFAAFERARAVRA